MNAEPIPIPEDPFAALCNETADFVRPVGWKVIVALAKTEEKTSGGVIKPDSLLEQEHTAQVVGLVVSMGDLCFSHPKFCGQRLEFMSKLSTWDVYGKGWARRVADQLKGL